MTIQNMLQDWLGKKNIKWALIMISQTVTVNLHVSTQEGKERACLGH